MLDIRPLAILAQVINFAVLMLVLHYFLFKPIREILKKRQEKIDDGFKDIDDQKAAVEQMRIEYDTKLKNIQIELQEMKRDAIRESQIQKEEIIASARADAENIIEKNRIRIENDSLRVLDDLREHIVEISMKTVKKVIDKNMTRVDHVEFIDKIIREAEDLTWQKK